MMRKFKLECRVITCRVITPLFMGGANQQAELRTQSINGVLRWWFRVLGGSFEDEKRLFGWGGEGANRGLVRMSVRNFDSLAKNRFQKIFDNRGKVRHKPRREYIKENQTFDLIIRFHPKATEEDIKKFFSALWCAFNLGNFGSRSRRGFGSIMIERVKREFPEDFQLEFKPNQPINEWIRKNLNTIRNLMRNPHYWQARKDIPYVFNNLEVYEYKQNDNWESLLDEAGKEYKNFRRSKNLNDKIVFGLPIVSSKKYRKYRRGSPLIFKIIKPDGDDYHLLFIVFYPRENKKFVFHPDPNIERSINWNILHQFLRGRRKIFP